MVDGLFIALVVKIGLSDVTVCQYQSELRFSVCEHEDLSQGAMYFGEGELMHPDIQYFLFVFSLEEYLQAGELFFKLLADFVCI